MQVLYRQLLISDVKVSERDLTNFVSKLLLQVLPVIDLGFMQVEQKEQDESNQVTLYFQVFDMVHVEEDVSVDLGEAEQDAQHLQIVIVFYVLVGHVSTPLASLKAVIVVLELSHDLGQGTAFDAYKSRQVVFVVEGFVRERH